MPDPSVLWYFLGAFVVLAAAGLGAPVPEEGVVVAAGVWVGSDTSRDPWRFLILPVCISGILVSDILLYSIGRLWGTRLLQLRWIARVLPPEKRERIEHNFHHYGIKILLMVRWIPGIRSPLFLTAGTMRLPLLRFILADSIAATVGHTLLFFLSYWFTDSFLDVIYRVERGIDRVRPIIVLSLIVAVALYFVYHFYRRPVTTGDPEEFPLIGKQVAAKMEGAEHRNEPPPPAEGTTQPAEQHMGQ